MTEQRPAFETLQMIRTRINAASQLLAEVRELAEHADFVGVAMLTIEAEDAVERLITEEGL